MLIDFANQPLLDVGRANPSGDRRGMANGVPATVMQVQGRISGINSHKQAQWATQGIEADCELFCLSDAVRNGDTVTDDKGVVYLVTGRSRRVTMNTVIPDYWKYPLKTESLK